MDTPIELLVDLNHWIGWVLTTTIITIVFGLIKVVLYEPWYYMLILLAVVIVVDVIKHQIKLQ